MWKTLSLLLLFALPSFTALAQKKKKDKGEETAYFVFDKNWKPTDVKNAYFLICEDKLGDSSYQVRYYNYTGPMINVETFADEKKTVPHGFWGYYDDRGRVDSCGYTYLAKKDGYWFYFDDSLKVTRQEKYNKGKLLEVKDEAKLKADRAERKENEAKADPSEKEASFKGGESGWRKYIEKNIDFPKRAQNMRTKGTVIVSFVVDTDGSISDVTLSKSVEYSVDNESIRLIKAGPKWEPAFQFGKNVKAFRRQPITFRFD